MGCVKAVKSGAQDFNPSTWETEGSEPLNSRSAWSTESSRTARDTERNRVSKQKKKDSLAMRTSGDHRLLKVASLSPLGEQRHAALQSSTLYTILGVSCLKGLFAQHSEVIEYENCLL